MRYGSIGDANLDDFSPELHRRVPVDQSRDHNSESQECEDILGAGGSTDDQSNAGTQQDSDVEALRGKRVEKGSDGRQTRRRFRPQTTMVTKMMVVS